LHGGRTGTIRVEEVEGFPDLLALLFCELVLATLGSGLLGRYFPRLHDTSASVLMKIDLWFQRSQRWLRIVSSSSHLSTEPHMCTGGGQANMCGHGTAAGMRTI
jgi:hypothetical protein